MFLLFFIFLVAQPIPTAQAAQKNGNPFTAAATEKTKYPNAFEALSKNTLTIKPTENEKKEGKRIAKYLIFPTTSLLGIVSSATIGALGTIWYNVEHGADKLAHVFPVAGFCAAATLTATVYFREIILNHCLKKNENYSPLNEKFQNLTLKAKKAQTPLVEKILKAGSFKNLEIAGIKKAIYDKDKSNKCPLATAINELEEANIYCTRVLKDINFILETHPSLSEEEKDELNNIYLSMAKNAEVIDDVKREIAISNALKAEQREQYELEIKNKVAKAKMAAAEAQRKAAEAEEKEARKKSNERKKEEEKARKKEEATAQELGERLRGHQNKNKFFKLA